MVARGVELDLLSRCSVVARDDAPTALDQREANVFQLAAAVVRSQFPHEAKCLMLASERYFSLHPNERLVASDVIRKGWVTSLPRLRDMLSQKLYERLKA